jgi:hypothetical protein
MHGIHGHGLSPTQPVTALQRAGRMHGIRGTGYRPGDQGL